MSQNRRIKSTSSSGSGAASRGRSVAITAPPGGGARGREVAGIMALGVSLFLLLALVSLQAGGLLMARANTIGALPGGCLA